jgi:hypothetical protein
MWQRTFMPTQNTNNKPVFLSLSIPLMQGQLEHIIFTKASLMLA